MVVAPHSWAADAGGKILKRGGNAVEALVAAGAALSVLYPHFCGLGGDAVWLVCDADGNADAFLGIGQAAQELPAMDAVPTRGPGSMLTTACLVDSWDTLLDYSADQWHGREALSSLLDDAIGFARDGFPVSPSQQFWYDFRMPESAAWPGFRDLFGEHGWQRQPALGDTLEQIARHGARDFYEGALARRIARGLAAAGSPLAEADLARTRTRREKPLSLRYRDLTLLAPGAPTQGVTTLQIMGILGHMEMSSVDPGGADFYHRIVEAVKRAFLDRASIADPDLSGHDIVGLLDGDRLERQAASIDPMRALSWPQPLRHGDTAFLAAVDDEGRAACVLQSLYFDWGSGVVLGDTGILWQNRGAAFSLDPAGPNRLEPGKRPFYTLNPGMALRDGRPHLVYGTQGADGQPQTLSLLLSLMIDHGLDPFEALSAPRFLLGKTFSDSADTLKIEENIGKEAIAALQRLGHEVSGIDALSPLGGQAGVIRLHADGSMVGAHDPRSDGGAIGL
jgi:gamma-glutamyltranspeptidase/glutathione hydrolase